ncbi:MAG: hypothetical protein ACJ8MR_04760 [Povalibacter sp.]|jgi:hypothetical protein
MKTISVARAIVAGYVFVNIPVALFIGAPMFLVAKYISNPSPWWIALLPGGFIVAWLWWSVAVPKWRLWAYERVEDIGELKRSAIDAQLLWPDGSIFEKTEIKSASHAERESALELACTARQSVQPDRREDAG